MKSTLKKLATAVVFTVGSMSMANAASLLSFGNPWGQIATVNAAMDAAFGVGSWNNVVNPTDTAALAGETFAYIEGGDSSTNEMETFLNNNSVALLAFLNGGGHLFINAAPNEGDGLSFGGLTLNNSDYCGTGCVASNPAHAIFAGITATNFTGTYFSHATVSGGTALIEKSGGAAILAELAVGSGSLLMGGMTTTNFHSFGEGLELRTNILTYAATGAVTPGISPVPLPAALPMLLAGLGGLGLMGRRRKAA